ncbi:putative C6 transcription factor [Paecilomyces variotii]|uniref:Putative C6 transcription factor n=1 Tax=Byssochlamys spectabilis TaxID=264951 RepID=A0A443I3N0_BYSSP|nr:putative C6 transcription factor [Paecilomyces variotii]RWQ98637.1 putative C6 transcription factor [Paecilomyces variotii]
MSARVGPYTAKASRRSHHKSRLGCQNCKRRRIKCDEAKPNCGNCLRHSIECDYNSSSESSSTVSPTNETTSLAEAPKPYDDYTFISSSQANFTPPKRAHSSRPPLSQQHDEQSSHLHQAVANKQFQFTATDMVLFHHFITSKDLGGSRPHVQNQLSQLGFSFHYVLRLLLAFSGFHLARYSTNDSSPGSSADFYAAAERHYETAVREVAAAIPLLDATNSPALYTSSIFVFICSLAKGPRPGEYLAYCDDGNPGCLSLFMGLRSILERCKSTLSVDFSSIHGANEQDETLQPEGPPFHPEEPVSHAYRDSLAELRHLISATFPDNSLEYTDYSQVLDMLCYTYEFVFGDDPRPTEPQLWPQIFGWLYTLPDLFVMDAQNRRPAALVMFAFFAVLLKQLDPAWFIRQWPEHIMSGIFRDLDEFHQEYVRWPMEQLGRLSNNLHLSETDSPGCKAISSSLLRN